MMTQGQLEKIPVLCEQHMLALQNRIMEDAVRRIRINGFSTASADWQLDKARQLGMSDKQIKVWIQDALKATDAEIDRIFSDEVYKQYYHHQKTYDFNGETLVPFEENDALQRTINAVKTQTENTFVNMTASLGFVLPGADGKLHATPVWQFYNVTLDKAIMDIQSGAFDYQTVLARTIKDLSNSGLRWVDYESGHHNRVDVATRRAVLTGFRQIQGRINEQVANELNCDMYEVSFHGGARPEHAEWQGKVYTMAQLISVCGLGTGGGLHGWNCYHDYDPFPPGSVRTYTDEQLRKLNQDEQRPRTYGDKTYTKYEALQEQRKMETAMRASRQLINLAKQGNSEATTLYQARYRAQLARYKSFSKAVNLPMQKKRIYQDGLKGLLDNG